LTIVSAVERAARVLDAVEIAITGKRDVIEAAFCVLLANGHLLIEDIPGVGKTTLSVELARACQEAGRKVGIMGLDQQHNAADVIAARGYAIPYHGLYVYEKVARDVQVIVENTMMHRFKDYAALVAPDLITMASLGQVLYDTRGQYDDVVVDFPPNHSGLSMLRLPNILHNIAWKAVTIKNRVRKLVTGHDEALEVAERMYGVLVHFRDVLDQDGCFLPVMAPGDLALAELVRLSETLRELSFRVGAYIFNLFPRTNPGCARCVAHVREATRLLGELTRRARADGVEVVVVGEGDFTALASLAR